MSVSSTFVEVQRKPVSELAYSALGLLEAGDLEGVREALTRLLAMARECTP